jgi:hypothetical protein
MSDKEPLKRIRRPIVINVTSSGGEDLKNCYFLASDEVEGFYSFFNERGETLATGVSDDVPFPFLLDGVAWTITKLKIHHHVEPNGIKAKGQWTNNVMIPNADGTFQSESGGGVEDEVELPVPSCTHPANAIEIETVTGGADKDKLKHCYFLPAATSGQYDLFSKHCVLLKSGLQTNTNFDFTHDSINWTVTQFVIDETAASGSWSNPNRVDNANGTFQAESGGGLGEGEGAASAASA